MITRQSRSGAVRASGFFPVALALCARANCAPLGAREIAQLYLDFLAPGATTRAEAIMRLGAPVGDVGPEQSVIWQLRVPERRGLVFGPETATHRLTVAFDRDDRVARFGLSRQPAAGQARDTPDGHLRRPQPPSAAP